MTLPDARATVQAGFLTECDELMETIRDGLIAIDTGVSTLETVHDMFRAVHSIKGGAAAFGYDGIVRFAHGFETALEGIRENRAQGKSASDPQIIQYLHRAADGLDDLIAAAHTGDPLPADSGSDTLTELIRLTKGAENPADINGEQLRTFRIVLTADPDAYQFEADLLGALKTLRNLGDVTTTIGHQDGSDTTPVFCTSSTDIPAISWHVILETSASQAAIYGCLDPISALYPYRLEDISLHSSQQHDADSETDRLGLFRTRNTPHKRNSLRVELGRIETLVNQVGELVIGQSMLLQTMEEAHLPTNSPILKRFEALKRLTMDLQDSVVMIRAQPIKSLFQRMSRVLRDAADECGKSVRLRFMGEDTEIDKIVLERLLDPLTHMVRNAVVHGIETQQTRIDLGKDPTGTLSLKALHRSGQVIVEISDDGAGIDAQAVLSHAKANKTVAQDVDVEGVDVFDLLFRPGFSTAQTLSDLAGRGIGMDVVRTSILDMSGRISMASDVGHGTSVTLSLPLTLAVLEGLLVKVADDTFVVPLASIQETLRLSPANLVSIGSDVPMVRLRDKALILHDLGALLAVQNAPKNYAGKTGLIVNATDSAPFVLAVDQIIDQRQIVIKGMPQSFTAAPGISGATILGGGEVALIIEPLDLHTVEDGSSASNRTQLA